MFQIEFNDPQISLLGEFVDLSSPIIKLQSTSLNSITFLINQTEDKLEVFDDGLILNDGDKIEIIDSNIGPLIDLFCGIYNISKGGSYDELNKSKKEALEGFILDLIDQKVDNFKKVKLSQEEMLLERDGILMALRYDPKDEFLRIVTENKPGIIRMNRDVFKVLRDKLWK